jgi:outer membrane lipoprotein-sorting protein
MACLTREQLVQLSLGIKEDATWSAHAAECDACRAALDDLGRLADQLTAAHTELDHNHAATRSRLLTSLATAQRPGVRNGVWNAVTSAFDRLTSAQRLAVGGVGLSTAAAVLVLLAVFASSSSQLSAMERIVNAVRDVTSFSYKLTNDSEFPPKKEKPARTLIGNSFTCWRAPTDTERDQFGDLRSAQSHEWVHHLPMGDQEPEVTLDLVEIHPTGKRGILIDYMAKKCYRVPPLHAGDIANSTPLLWLRAVRERAGTIVDELGSRQLNGREAHGYTMTFDDASSFRDFGPVEVWVDPQTDLPVEFYFQYAKDEEGIVDKYSVTDLQWNIDLDPKLFDTTPPAGFLDITLPEDERLIAEVTAALKLYAELSGGRYPHVDKLDDRNFATKFDAAACYGEMLELAGFTGPQRDEWASDPKYRRIQQSRPGLDTLERILQSYKWLIGYNGSTVRREGKHQVLLWWNVAMENAKDDHYRLFYGDLRTEIVPRQKWVQFVPPDIAEIGE